MNTDVQVQVFAQFINGEWVPGSSGELIDVINPATSEVVAKVAKGSGEDIEQAVLNAREVFESGVW